MKRIMAFLLSTILITGNMVISVNADTIDETEVHSSDAIVYSAGLISSYSVSISKNGNTIYMSGSTSCFSSMQSVGFKDVVLQRSTDGINWSNYSNVGDILSSSTYKCSVSNKNLGTVPVGYKYRVICTHYAKETGLFGKSESIANTSNIV